MRKTLLIAAATASAGLAALAGSAGAAQPVGAVSEVRVTFGDDIERKPRVFGQREKDRLANEIKLEVAKAMGGLTPGGGVLEVTLEDVKPNRPTWTQMSYQPGLSYIDSFGIGGATIEAVYVAPGGARTPVRYSWYESDIRQSRFVGDWYDADKAIERFAKKLKN